MTTALISFYRIDELNFAGSAIDPEDPDRCFVIELLLDGVPVAWLPADKSTGGGVTSGGSHGFHYMFPSRTLERHFTVSARVANSDTPGATVLLASPIQTPSAPLYGEVYLAGESTVRGWLKPVDGVPNAVFVVDGRVIANVEPDHWVSLAATSSGPYGFTAVLSGKLPRSGFNQVHVFDNDGGELAGSPVLLHGEADKLAASLVMRDQAVTRSAQLGFYRSRFPEFVPFSHYEAWHDDMLSSMEQLEPASHAVILVGSGDLRESIRTLRIGQSSTKMAFAATDPRSPVEFQPQSLVKALEGEEDLPDLVVLAPAGTLFIDAQLERACAQFYASQATIAYGDLEMVQNGERRPLFFPAFDYERLLEQAYCSQVYMARRNDLVSILREHSPSTLFDLFFRLLEKGTKGSVLHVPFPLARLPECDVPYLCRLQSTAVKDHLSRLGHSATVQYDAEEAGGLIRVKVRRTISRDATIGVIIPTRDRSDLLRQSIDTVAEAAGDMRVRFLVMDNGSVEPETEALLLQLRGRGVDVIRDTRAFNYARINNDAVANLDTEFICFINNDVEFEDPDTFQEMLGRLMAPDVGAVGVLMRRADDVIQHGGVVLGPHGGATHSYVDHVIGSHGYAEGLRVAHQTSAVTAACLMMRRLDFLAIGGFDQVAFPVAFNDVDLCQRLVKAGKRIVMTPHVHIIHHESLSRGSDATINRSPRFARELANLRDRWSGAINDDPFYNPYLDRSSHPYSGLNCTKGDAAPRERGFDLISAHPTESRLLSADSPAPHQQASQS